MDGPRLGLGWSVLGWAVLLVILEVASPVGSIIAARRVTGLRNVEPKVRKGRLSLALLVHLGETRAQEHCGERRVEP